MGPAALGAYVVVLGLATFLLKVSLEHLSAFQINVLMGVAMLLVAVPGVLITKGTLSMPLGELPLGALVALLMAGGSVLYAVALRHLPAGPTAAIATSYVLLVVVLSVVFLGESFDVISASGVVLTLAGVALLSLRA